MREGVRNGPRRSSQEPRRRACRAAAVPVARRSGRPADAPGDEGRPVPALRAAAAARAGAQPAWPVRRGRPRDGGEHPAGPAVQHLAGAPARLPAAVVPARRSAGRAARHGPADDGPARPHAAATARGRRVHPEGHRWTRAVDPRTHGPAAGGGGRRSRLRPDRRAGLPSPDRGHLPSARRTSRGSGPVPGLGSGRGRQPGPSDGGGRPGADPAQRSSR